ncbi:ABC transporter ATP-binding protein/permease [Paracoccus zhejiangensis]|uniref:Cysteine ABC transporter permease n=1 Tax=Paracoccus zhejiangensis TaxID=1077935 RepID=A0A2H5EVC7_9RHOB|nr:ATP-binding cassette domain-containing protein [Paracoccus zhejiangensis]AUH63258.1 cysteine ABC transporter permease [Paracoccus zhejiangensis]
MSRASANDRADLERITRDQSGQLKRAAVLATLAEALWTLQAGLVALVLAGLAQGTETAGRDLLLGTGGFLLVGLVRAGLNALAGLRLARAGDALTGVWRAKLLERADRRAPEAGAAPSATIAALATDKLALLLPYLRRWPVARMRVATVPLLILLLALTISWAAALIFAITGPLIPVFMALVGMAAGQASRERMDEISDMNALLVERLTALTDIRLLDARGTMLAGFAETADRLRRRTMRVLALAFLSSTVLELFSALGVAMMALYVGFSLLGLIDFGLWREGLGLGQGIFLLMLAPAFYQPMRDLAAAWHDRADALALARDLAAEMDRPAPQILGEGGAAVAMGFTGLQLRGVSIEGRAIPDFDLAPGESLALTGPSGAGKSRLIALLAGLGEAAPGQVLVSGQPIGPDTADGWRAGLALIPQQVHFGDETLAETLGVGPDGAEGLEEALRLAHAQDIVARLPEGLQTRLGERGAGVSGGEARRLMIARAALRRPALLLADEPTADLDDETAAEVIAGLMDLHRAGATLVVASHDPRLIAAMGRRIAL